MELKTGRKTFHFHEQVCLLPLLIYEQDMEANRSSQDFKVNVKVNAAPPEDLAKILAEIREDYEAIIEKNRQSLDSWYKEQVTALSCSFQRSLLLSVNGQNHLAFAFNLLLLPRAQLCLWQLPPTQSRYSAVRTRSRIWCVLYSPWTSSCRHRWVRYLLQTPLAGHCYFMYSQQLSWTNSSFKSIA